MAAHSGVAQTIPAASSASSPPKPASRIPLASSAATGQVSVASLPNSAPGKCTFPPSTLSFFC
jgi:hypothetical protein